LLILTVTTHPITIDNTIIVGIKLFFFVSARVLSWADSWLGSLTVPVAVCVFSGAAAITAGLVLTSFLLARV
jgi:hypothetical protein